MPGSGTWQSMSASPRSFIAALCSLRDWNTSVSFAIVVSTIGEPKVSLTMCGADDMNRTVSEPHEGHGFSVSADGSNEKSVAQSHETQARSKFMLFGRPETFAGPERFR